MRNKQQQACLDEKLRLIMECRQSALSDKQWREENGIQTSTFYNWVSRFRHKHGYDIPDSPYQKHSYQKQDRSGGHCTGYHYTTCYLQDTDPQPCIPTFNCTDHSCNQERFMMGDISVVDEIYIVCRYTDMSFSYYLPNRLEPLILLDLFTFITSVNAISVVY